MTTASRSIPRGNIARCAPAVCAALFCSACPQRTAVWVAGGSSDSGPVLHISDVRGGTRVIETGGVRVDRCDHEPTGDGAMWLVGPRDGTGPVRELAYGAAPPGWVVDQGPKPLTPGCYQVTLSGNGRTVFDVRQDGAVVERRSETK